MKKSILIFCASIAILSLTAFGINSMNHHEIETPPTDSDELAVTEIETDDSADEEAASNIFMAIGSRFGGMTLAEIQEVTTMYDFLSEEDKQRNLNFSYIEVIEIIDEKESERRAGGYSTTFNQAQIDMLYNSGYSSNLKVQGNYSIKNPETGKMEKEYYSPHITIVPEYEAIYSEGIDGLLDYLRTNSMEAVVSSNEDKMRPAKLYFTINTEGKISKVSVRNTCGFKHLDDKLEVLMWEAPGTWEPARSATGETVEQELVLSYGLAGC